jgi:hypothetical protein
MTDDEFTAAVAAVVRDWCAECTAAGMPVGAQLRLLAGEGITIGRAAPSFPAPLGCPYCGAAGYWRHGSLCPRGSAPGAAAALYGAPWLPAGES